METTLFILLHVQNKLFWIRFANTLTNKLYCLNTYTFFDLSDRSTCESVFSFFIYNISYLSAQNRCSIDDYTFFFFFFSFSRTYICDVCMYRIIRALFCVSYLLNTFEFLILALNFTREMAFLVARPRRHRSLYAEVK